MSGAHHRASTRSCVSATMDMDDRKSDVLSYSLLLQALWGLFYTSGYVGLGADMEEHLAQVVLPGQVPR